MSSVAVRVSSTLRIVAPEPEPDLVELASGDYIDLGSEPHASARTASSELLRAPDTVRLALEIASAAVDAAARAGAPLAQINVLRRLILKARHG